MAPILQPWVNQFNGIPAGVCFCASAYPVAGKDVEFVLANAWQTEHIPGRKLPDRKQLCPQEGPAPQGGSGRSSIGASWKSLLPSSSDNTIDTVTKELIQKEIDFFPEPYLAEILDFIYFLRARALKDKSETAILSESVLARDWLSAEEDRAWEDL